MAIAGKVAITPGGEWSVDVAYDKLVIVTFGNNVYLSIKPSTGIEPTNEEYWMLLIENVTQEQYDNIINGTTPAGNALKLNGLTAEEFVKQHGTLLSLEQVNNANWRDNYEGVVDVATGTSIGLDTSNNCWWHIKYFKNTNADGYGSQLALPLLRTNANQIPKYRTSNGLTFGGWSNVGDGGNADTVDGLHASDFIHTGNKPTGTYTGNGSATKRTISTGGKGIGYLIYGSNDTMAIVSEGAICRSGGELKSLSSGLAHMQGAFTDGNLYLATTDAALNADGVTYYYQVL